MDPYLKLYDWIAKRAPNEATALTVYLIICAAIGVTIGVTIDAVIDGIRQ